ncbi:MAG TPA: biotin--[acetyl-CoA-carboxylase] ligase, partial [Candidatus Scatosoma pullistercoris]|nr:biotin--[acetyl-CoA-carboxylase] ligase [Candidatus Scatosoma pullistercoris]
MKIVRLDEVDSTNLYARSLIGEGEELAVIALRQTGGRGTKGRQFVSEAGGVYLTRLKFPADFPASQA